MNSAPKRKVVCAAIRAADGEVLVGIRHYSADMHRQIEQRALERITELEAQLAAAVYHLPGDLVAGDLQATAKRFTELEQENARLREMVDEFGEIAVVCGGVEELAQKRKELEAKYLND